MRTTATLVECCCPDAESGIAVKTRVVIGCIFRPHMINEWEGPCWCRPQTHVCEEHGVVEAHRVVEARPDERERMASFSEQLPLRSTWNVAAGVRL